MATVLIVDDNQSFRQLNAEFLRMDGHRVLTASNGRETLELVRRERPDIVLLDIMMPGIDGYEICREIKADPETARTVVVMVTALPSSARYKSLQAGADEHVSKPVASRDLRAIVNRWSGHASLVDGARAS
ncbi:MAG: response regulator [Anaerolineae bacterium]|nr:response regulator [Anaerolineae bacterium]